MSIIPQVKCRRCGVEYSALSSRCPNCGTKKVSQSGHTPAPTPSTVKGTAAYDKAAVNSKWQMIFGLILVAAVIIAVIVMISTGIDGTTQSGVVKATPPPAVTNDPNTAPELPPTPTPTPTPSVSSIEIYFYTTKSEDVSMYVGDEALPFRAVVYPLELGVSPGDIHWSSSDESIITVTPKNDGSGECTVAPVAAGTANLQCEVFGYMTTCIIRVRER